MVGISVFTTPEKVDALFDEMASYFSKYANDFPVEMLLTIRDASNYKSGVELRNMLNSYYLPPYSIVIITMLSVLSMALLITFYNSKEIAIRYLHGHSEIKVLSHLYLKYFINTLLIYVGGVVITALIIADSMGE